MYTTIPVDFEVYQKLTSLLRDENDTYNNVLRRQLGLTIKAERVPPKPIGTPWISKGVTFPHGTDFRSNYKGQVYEAKVDNGALVFNNKRFKSPSEAAVSITGNMVNGWIFWECKLPGSNTWVTIKSLRKR